MSKFPTTVWIETDPDEEHCDFRCKVCKMVDMVNSYGGKCEHPNWRRALDQDLAYTGKFFRCQACIKEEQAWKETQAKETL